MNGATVSIWIICLAIFVIQAVTINVIRNILNTLEEMQLHEIRIVRINPEEKTDETPAAE
jgi:hypothetical protein